MVVKEDGTKWACQSCLKGHRVSGCTHVDRELTLVPKKGRPVTQCQHCRLERKKRAAHVKCDCGETDKPHHSKEKCIHLREAEERAKAGFHDEHGLDKDPAHLAAVAEEQGCCCLHGGKCTCAFLKKDPNIPKDDTLPHGPAVHKPRLETTRSDGSLTVFANGHHKHVHRKNHAAHECGMPYKMPMSRAHTDQAIPTGARRSVDSLALDTAMQSRLMSLGSNPSLSVANQHFSNSEQPSPTSAAVCARAGLIDPGLSSVDFSDIGPARTAQSMDSTGSDFMAFPQLDPMSATADSSYDPWSNFPSGDGIMYPDNNPFGAWATNFDNGGHAQPALTVASSGTQSEIDEVPPMEDLHNFHMPSIQETGPLDMGINFDDAANINRRSLPPNFFKNLDFDMPTLGNGWPSELGNDIPGDDGAKEKAASNDQMPGTFDWERLAKRNTSQRTPNAFATGRAQSHSIGPSHAPSDEIMKQLFPEDYNANFGQNNGVLDMTKLSGLPIPPTSNGTDLGFNDDAEFPSQLWADGSISVPNNDFATAYDFNQEFANPPSFSANWPQQ